MRVAGLILAGGSGRRLGGADKARVLLAGRPLLAHVLARLAPQAAPIALSANGDTARFAAFGLPVLPDPPGLEGEGPLAGLLAGLNWAAGEGAEAVLSVAVDTPFIPADLAQRLAKAAGPGPEHPALAHPALATSAGRAHPACALWPVALRGALGAALGTGTRRLGLFAAQCGAVKVAFAGEPDPFFNINTPAELAAAEAWLTRTSPSRGPEA